MAHRVTWDDPVRLRYYFYHGWDGTQWYRTPYDYARLTERELQALELKPPGMRRVKMQAIARWLATHGRTTTLACSTVFPLVYGEEIAQAMAILRTLDRGTLRVYLEAGRGEDGVRYCAPTDYRDLNPERYAMVHLAPHGLLPVSLQYLLDLRRKKLSFDGTDAELLALILSAAFPRLKGQSLRDRSLDRTHFTPQG